MKFFIRSVTFGPDGSCLFDYSKMHGSDADQRRNGMSRSQQLFIPGEVRELADELQELYDKADVALKKVLTAYEESLADPWELDDGTRPYDHPDDGGES